MSEQNERDAAREKEALLPCPFCGNDAELFNPDELDCSVWDIRCNEPDCYVAEGAEWRLEKSVVIAKWNTRELPAGYQAGQASRSQWVAVEDRLPDSEGHYFITLEYKSERFTHTVEFYAGSFYWPADENFNDPIDGVIAWMDTRQM